jgi:predicted transcriptional regulator
MYDDPTHIRAHEIKVRLNDDEMALVDALARFNRRQRAAFVRELLMASVDRLEHLQSTDTRWAD